MEDRFWLAIDDAGHRNEKGWFDNLAAYCKPRTAFHAFKGGRYILAIWNTMILDKHIIWANNPLTEARRAGLLRA
ncbi:MAG: hypothetical protein L0Z50_39030 [Verrucomicrobiales bacterium]|nr:hypothetical protein [Verrucomicrobiales bacterium]